MATQTKKQTPAKLKGAARKAQLTAEAAAADIKLAGPELTDDMFEQAEATAADIKLVPGPELMEAMEIEAAAAAVAEAVKAEPEVAVVEVPAPKVDAIKATKPVAKAKAAKAETEAAAPKAPKAKRTVRIVAQDDHFAMVIVNPRPGPETDRAPWTHKTAKACETDCARNGWIVQ